MSLKNFGERKKLTDEELGSLLINIDSKYSVKDLRENKGVVFFIERVDNGFIMTVFNGFKKKYIAKTEKDIIEVINKFSSLKSIDKE